MTFPIYQENKIHVPNHQLDIYIYIINIYIYTYEYTYIYQYSNVCIYIYIKYQLKLSSTLLFFIVQARFPSGTSFSSSCAWSARASMAALANQVSSKGSAWPRPLGKWRTKGIQGKMDISPGKIVMFSGFLWFSYSFLIENCGFLWFSY